MDLESYFIILDPDDIRLKGTRIGIETVLDDYLNGISPKEIAARYRSITLEQVYATITYYLHNQREVEAYLARWRAYCDAAWQEQECNPTGLCCKAEGNYEPLLMESSHASSDHLSWPRLFQHPD